MGALCLAALHLPHFCCRFTSKTLNSSCLLETFESDIPPHSSVALSICEPSTFGSSILTLPFNREERLSKECRRILSPNWVSLDDLGWDCLAILSFSKNCRNVSMISLRCSEAIIFPCTSRMVSVQNYLYCRSVSLQCNSTSFTYENHEQVYFCCLWNVNHSVTTYEGTVSTSFATSNPVRCRKRHSFNCL